MYHLIRSTTNGSKFENYEGLKTNYELPKADPLEIAKWQKHNKAMQEKPLNEKKKTYLHLNCELYFSSFRWGRIFEASKAQKSASIPLFYPKLNEKQFEVEMILAVIRNSGFKPGTEVRLVYISRETAIVLVIGRPFQLRKTCFDKLSKDPWEDKTSIDKVNVC